MGIQNLNSYLRKYTTDKAINKITLKELSGKKIVVDTSIYLYRFISEDALLENMYIMITLFKTQSFLQNQVRSMVGCLKYLSCSDWDLKKFKKIFKSKNRKLCAPPAPACGLYLVKIKY